MHAKTAENPLAPSPQNRRSRHWIVFAPTSHSTDYDTDYSTDQVLVTVTVKVSVVADIEVVRVGIRDENGGQRNKDFERYTVLTPIPLILKVCSVVLGQWSTGLAVGYLASSLVAGINDINSVITEGGAA